MDKKPMSIRLSEEGRTLLEEVARVKGVSRTAVIEMAIRAFAEREGFRSRQVAGPHGDDH